MMDPLSVTLSALADPTRRAILAQLRKGEASVAQLAEPFDMSVRGISKHLAVLENAGLVERRREAQRRLSKIRLVPLKAVDKWLTAYRVEWERRMDRIGEVLAELNKRRDDDPRGK
jgi:DNA-binding transcriptional ArsR family regulator